MEPLNTNQGSVVPDGLEVTRRRHALGWTQDELADKAGISKRTATDMEAGQTRIRISNLKAVAKALGAPLAAIVCEAMRPHFQHATAEHLDAQLSSPPAPLPLHRPQQLPLYLADFTGRADEIQRMEARLLTAASGTAALSAVHGMGGVGKTSLAVRVAHNVKDSFPSGQLFLDLKGMHPEPLTVGQALAQLFQSLRPEARLPQESDRLVADYRSTLACAGRVLIVLDNAAGVEQVRPLLPGPPAGVIVTSRQALSLSEYGAVPISLSVLRPNEALGLLRGIIGRRGTDNELQKVVKLCGCLPLAVRVAGDFLRLRPDWTVMEYIDALSQERLRWLKAGNDQDVEAVLRLSAVQLVRESLEKGTRWALLAEHHGAFDKQMAAQIWGLAVDDLTVRDDLSALVARGMLEYDATADMYRLHDLMHPIAASLFGKSPTS